MSSNNSDRPKGLPDEIRRQIGSPGTTRFLRTLPAFQIDLGTPDHLAELLMELDRAEVLRDNSRSR